MTNFRTLDDNVTPYALALTEGFGDFVDDSCLGIYMLGVDVVDVSPINVEDLYNMAAMATRLEDRLILEISGALPSEVGS